jgi:hypothetical protein
MMMDAQWMWTMMKGRSGPAAMMLAVVVAGGCATPAASPDQAPDWRPQIQAAYTGWCYAVEADDWSPNLVDRFPELEGFSMPRVVYLGLEQDHGAMGAGVSTGNEELSWEDAREARWIGDQPFDNEPWAFDHAHWWQMDDGSYRIGFAGSYQFWVGFEAQRTPSGLEGVFRYWGQESLAEAGEPEVVVGASLDRIDCTGTPFRVEG